MDLIVDAMKLRTHHSALNLLRAAHRGHTDWLITKANGMFVLDRHALRLLRHQLSGISDQEKALLVSQLPMVS